MLGMPVQYPISLGARTVRQEHKQKLLCIPKALVDHWRLRRSDVVYWSLLDATHAMISVVPKPVPPTFEQVLGLTPENDDESTP